MKNKKGSVYFFKHIGIELIKIGCCKSDVPFGRFKEFKSFAPYGAECLGYIITENPYQLESELHRLFSSNRHKGEWFNLSSSQVIEILKSNSGVVADNSIFLDHRNDVTFLSTVEIINHVKTSNKSMSAVAIELGISRNTLYRHINKKVLPVTPRVTPVLEKKSA